MTLIALLLTLLQAPITPTLTKITEDGEQLRATFAPGAIVACTIYELQTPEGYAPKHCWILDPSETGYDDNWEWIKREQQPWKVYTRVQYPHDAQGQMVFMLSNVLDIVR